jgi:hypothetical protein
MPRIIKKQIGTYLNEYLTEQHKDTGQPKNKLIAKFLADSVLDESIPIKVRVEIAREVIDRCEGKAVQTNLNAEIGPNPFESIPTEILEGLKAKAEALKTGK